jgi:hypothetical protein
VLPCTSVLQVIGVGASVIGDMSSRPNWGLNELDFVFATLVVGGGVIVNAAAADQQSVSMLVIRCQQQWSCRLHLRTDSRSRRMGTAAVLQLVLHIQAGTKYAAETSAKGDVVMKPSAGTVH